MGKKSGVVDRANSGASTRLWINLADLWSHEDMELNIMAGQITEIRVKRPKLVGDDVLVIVKASLEGRQFVAFSAGIDAAEALASALARAKQEALKWKPDEYSQQTLFESPPKGG